MNVVQSIFGYIYCAKFLLVFSLHLFVIFNITE